MQWLGKIIQNLQRSLMFSNITHRPSFHLFQITVSKNVKTSSSYTPFRTPSVLKTQKKSERKWVVLHWRCATWVRTNYSWLQVHKHCSGNMFTSSHLTEESVKWIISASSSFITEHLTIRLDPVFKTIQFPACIANLNTSLTNVDRYAFTLQTKKRTMIMWDLELPVI